MIIHSRTAGLSCIGATGGGGSGGRRGQAVPQEHTPVVGRRAPPTAACWPPNSSALPITREVVPDHLGVVCVCVWGGGGHHTN